MNIRNKFSTLKQKLYPFQFQPDARILARRILAFVFIYVFSAWMFTTVSLAFVSRLGDKERAGCALAITIYSLIGNSILMGISFGCDTLLPHCFGGNKHKMGIIVQRAIIIDLCSCFLIWILMLNAVSCRIIVFSH